MIPWLITSFTVIVVYILDRIEHKYIKSIFDWVPAILLAYLIPAGISYFLNQDYSGADIHSYSKDYFIPLAIIAVMSSLSIEQLKLIGWKPIVLFVSGSLWVAVFPAIFIYFTLDNSFTAEFLIAESYWKGIPPIVGSWIGGSTSQLVLKEVIECPENIFLTILVMDNILVNIWTILMFQGIKKSDWLNRFFKISDLSMPEQITQSKGQKLNPTICFMSLLCCVFATNYLIGSFIIKIIALSLIGLLISNLIRDWNFNFSLKAGSILILVVMAVLGLKLKFSGVQFDYILMSFLVVWLISHFVIMMIVAKLLNLNFAWVPIASMANVGGIATAPAVTAAYQIKWMPHAIILAILSMATGTIWGLLTIYLIQTMV